MITSLWSMGAWLGTCFWFECCCALVSGSIVIGGAELLGEGLTASFADRLGLKRALLLGLALSARKLSVLTVRRHNPAGRALFALFLVFNQCRIYDCHVTVTVLLKSCRCSGDNDVRLFCHGRCRTNLWNLAGRGALGKQQITLIAVVSSGMSVLALFILIWGLRK